MGGRDLCISRGNRGRSTRRAHGPRRAHRLFHRRDHDHRRRQLRRVQLRAQRAAAHCESAPHLRDAFDRTGYVGVCTNSRQQFDDFLLLIDRPDLLGDEQLARAPGRQERWDEWNDIVHAWSITHTTADAVRLASELRIPVAPVHNGADILQCDHFAARGIYVDDPTGTFKMPRRAWRMNDVDPPPPTPSPRLGEHTRAAAFASTVDGT